MVAEKGKGWESLLLNISSVKAADTLVPACEGGTLVPPQPYPVQ